MSEQIPDIRPGEENRIHDPIEAEYMAYAEKPHTDYATHLGKMLPEAEQALEQHLVNHPYLAKPRIIGAHEIENSDFLDAETTMERYGHKSDEYKPYEVRNRLAFNVGGIRDAKDIAQSLASSSAKEASEAYRAVKAVEEAQKKLDSI